MFSQLWAFLHGFYMAKRNQGLSAVQCERMQQRKRDYLLAWVTEHSLYYQDYQGCEFKQLPVINKLEYLNSFEQLNTRGLSLSECEALALKAEGSRNFSTCVQNDLTVGLSSGTSQRRGVFLLAKREQALWAGYIIGKNLPFAFKKQKVALLLRANSNLYESVNGCLLQFQFFDLTQSLDKISTQLERYQPDILVAPSHVLGRLAEQGAAISPSKILAAAEVLESDTQRLAEAHFDCRVDQIYQATEGYLASTCSHGQLHLNEDIVYIEKEWVDQASGRFIPIVSDFYRRAQPIVRYRLDDVLVVDPRPCACGSSFTRLKSIEGRCDDVLWLPSNKGGQLRALFPDLVRRAIYSCAFVVADYRLEQYGMEVHLTLPTNCTAQDEAQFKATLQQLFEQQELVVPIVKMYRGINQRSTDKLRRIRCVERPTHQPNKLQHLHQGVA